MENYFNYDVRLLKDIVVRNKEYLKRDVKDSIIMLILGVSVLVSCTLMIGDRPMTPLNMASTIFLSITIIQVFLDQQKRKIKYESEIRMANLVIRLKEEEKIND